MPALRWNGWRVGPGRTLAETLERLLAMLRSGPTRAPIEVVVLNPNPEIIAAQAHISSARNELDKAQELLMRGTTYFDRQRAIAILGSAVHGADEVMRITNAELARDRALDEECGRG